MKGSKVKTFDKTKWDMIFGKLKKLGTAIEMFKGPEMNIDDSDYRWVNDRIEYYESQDKQWQTILDAANKIEKLNYESLWVYDHFHTVPKPTQDPTYECWTLMSALSQTTNKLRLGQMCTCNSYRNPAYLTKVASNIDVMSGGRLEYAIGAG